MKLLRPLVALDLETTGPHPKRDRIVQIGVVKKFPDGREKEWETLINPMKHIPEEISKVHGITDDMVADECPFEVIAKGFQQAIRDCDLCGYNIHFDIRFLTAEYARLNRRFVYGKVVDSFKIFMKREKRNLSSAVEFYLGEKHESAHTALADARASLRVLEAQIKRYSDIPDTVDGLHTYLWDTVPEGFLDAERKIFLKDGVPCLNFGEEAGTPVAELSNRFLNWILRKDFSDRVKDLARETLENRRK